MTIKTELTELMARKGYSQTQVARAIGKSSTLISQYIQGKYPGDVKNIDELVSGFITREREKEKAARINVSFVNTVTASRALG